MIPEGGRAMRGKKRLLAAFLTVMMLLGMMTGKAWAETTVSTVNLYLDIASIGLYEPNQEKDVAKAVANNALVHTNGLEKNTVNSGLFYMHESYGNIYGIGGGTEIVKSTRQYYAGIFLDLSEGYTWTSGVKYLKTLQDVPVTSVSGFKVIFNGEVRNDAFVTYFGDSLRVYVPIANEAITVGKKPSIKKPAVTKNKITVKWSHFRHTKKKQKAVWKKIKKVQIQCALDKGFTNIVKVSYAKKTKTQAVLKGLQKKTTYYVRVRYYDGTGYSKWSGVKKIRTK